jgi:hypothetical protein
LKYGLIAMHSLGDAILTSPSIAPAATTSVVTMVNKGNHRECAKYAPELMHVHEQPSVLRGGRSAHRRESTVLRIPVEELIESVYEYEDKREHCE